MGLSKKEIIEKLREYFKKEDDVELAFLFGSYSKNREVEESDVDIGIYINKEWNLEKIHQKWREIEEMVGRNVEFVLLNKARPVIVWEALRGIPLKIKDRRFYIEYMLKISREAEDFADFVIDFYNLREKIKNGTA